MAPVNITGRQGMTLYELIESQGYLSLDSMEGSLEVHRPPSLEGSKWALAPGILLAALLTVSAALLSKAPFPPFTMKGAALEHPLGVSVLAILLGLVFGSTVKLSKRVKLGCKWVAYWLIPVAIVCLGGKMEMAALQGVAGKMVLGVIAIMAVALGGGVIFGRLFGLGKRTSYLLGVGSAVCGSSAVMAVAPVTEADDEEVVLAVGAVNLVGLIAMMACVVALWIVPLDASFYGAWAGSTIHAVPQVIAAGQSHGADAASMATLVKLLRVSLLVPVVIGTAFVFGRAKNGQKGFQKERLVGVVPWFVWGFAIVVAIKALGWLPELVFENGNTVDVSQVMSDVSKWLLALAMAAIGFQVNLKSMAKSGGKAMLAAVCTWGVMAASAFLLLGLLV
ncbi:YeiH family protein [Rubritalea squalenifaciens]|nr:putative sulfate exporter family transporter [Rubritalea squalenifaciens]